MKNKTIHFIITALLLTLISTKVHAQIKGSWYFSTHVDAGMAAEVLSKAIIESALNAALNTDDEYIDLFPEPDPDNDAKFRFGFDVGYQFNTWGHFQLDAGVNVNFYNIRQHPNHTYYIEDDYLYNQRNTALSAVLRPTYYFGSDKKTQFFGSVGVKMTKCYTRIFYEELSDEDGEVPRYLSKANAESAVAPFYVHLVPAAGFKFNNSLKATWSCSLEWEKTRWDNSYNNLQLVKFGVPSNYQFAANGVISIVVRLDF